MVSWSGHVLPVVATVAVWFLATGLVAWLDNRDRATFPRSLALAGLGGMAGLVMVVVAAQSTQMVAIYAAFAGAMLIWGWHELGFLTGAVAGPRRETCPPGAGGWQRFRHAAAAMAWHEAALLVTALALVSLCWWAPNPLGAQLFALLLVLRLSAKLNIFAGVPNMSTDMLPPHLAYLKSYFGPTRLGPLLIVSIIGTIALALWLGSIALHAPAGSTEAAAASLLFALAALGALEHLFLALPVRDGALWGWALPSRETAN